MRRTAALLVLCAATPTLFAQQGVTDALGGTLRAVVQIDAQAYVRDSVLDPAGDYYPDEKALGQGWALFTYERGNLRMGMRYENYQNAILGFPTGYRGEGITYRYAQWNQGKFDITVGNFFEQFGQGLIFRAYEERGLGLDNAMDGSRIIARLPKGLTLKTVLGRQRVYFAKSEGILRGTDAEWAMRDALPFLDKAGVNLTLGASFVSKFQRGFDPLLNLPSNVGAWAYRMGANYKGFNLKAEYAYKINDPNFDNGYIYKPGEAFVATATYSKKGLGFLATVKRIDNFSFRSDRNAQQFDALINFIPPTGNLHTYALPALYPYATQINGEMGYQFDVNYLIPRKSLLGGKYGTKVALSIASSQSIDRSPLADGSFGDKGTQGYLSNPLTWGEIPYFRDVNLSLSRKFSSKYKTQLTGYRFVYNKSVLADGLNDYAILDAPDSDSALVVPAVAWEQQFALPNHQTLRTELQWSGGQGYRGAMGMFLAEYTLSEKWVVAVQDIFNYGHPSESRRIHYPLLSVVHFDGPTRVQIGYGRQQQGIFCVGGVCRVVPPSNGLSLSLTTQF
jgi:hypothetical protein